MLQWVRDDVFTKAGFPGARKEHRRAGTERISKFASVSHLIGFTPVLRFEILNPFSCCIIQFVVLVFTSSFSHGVLSVRAPNRATLHTNFS